MKTSSALSRISLKLGLLTLVCLLDLYVDSVLVLGFGFDFGFGLGFGWSWSDFAFGLFWSWSMSCFVVKPSQGYVSHRHLTPL